MGLDPGNTRMWSAATRRWDLPNLVVYVPQPSAESSAAPGRGLLAGRGISKAAKSGTSYLKSPGPLVQA